MSNADLPSTDSFQGADETVFSQGHDRRRVIKFGTAAAGVAFLTPTLLTLGASPASASGDGAFKAAITADGSGRSIPIPIQGPGLWVLAYYVRGNLPGSSTPVTINSPTLSYLSIDGETTITPTWTALGAQVGTTSSGVDNTKITMKAFYAYVDPETWDPDGVTPNAGIAYATTVSSVTSTSGLLRGATAYNFPNATTATGYQVSTVGSGSVPSTTATVPASRFLVMGGAIHSTTLVPATPSGYGGVSQNLDSTAKLGTIATASFLSTAKVGINATSGTVTLGWGSTPNTQVATLVSIG